MAPPKRPKKYNLEDARMEVAVEHVSRKGWGFEEKIVRKVAAELLETYIEDWHFIEMDNYAVLIEQILEYQEMNSHGGSSRAGNKDESTQDDMPTKQALDVSGEALTSQGETSNEQALAVSCEAPATQGETTNKQALALSGGSPAATAENVSQDDTAEAAEGDDTVSDKAIVISRRRPCYGWISDDDDDDDEPQELLLLTPAGEVDKVISVTKTGENQRKRKSM